MNYTNKAAIAFRDLNINHTKEIGIKFTNVHIVNTGLDDLIYFCNHGVYPERPISYMSVIIGSDGSIEITSL